MATEEVKKDAPAAEEKKTETVEDTKTAPKDGEKKVDDAKVGDLLKDPEPKEEKKEPKMVPESVLIEAKKAEKTAKRELAALKIEMEKGATKVEISASVKELAEKHGISEEAAAELAKSIRAEVEADKAEEIDAIKKPLAEKERLEKREKVFNDNYDKTLAAMPEYKDIINKDVIKRAAFDPENKDKTFAQIFESSFGHLITGKKTLETTKNGGGKEDTAIDYEKASKDSKYFSEIMADPDRKKEYNENIGKRLKL